MGFFRKKHIVVEDRPSFLSGLVKLLAVLLVIAVAVAVLLGTGVIQTSAHRITAFELRNIGELATQSGYFTSVKSIEKKRQVLGVTVPGTTGTYTFSYDGIIKAGINFEDIGIEVDDKEHVIRITLPEVQLLSTEILPESFTSYQNTDNIFSPLEIGDISQAQAMIREDARATAVANGIKEAALDNAKLLIKGFLAGCYDMTVYRVEFVETESSGGDAQ